MRWLRPTQIPVVIAWLVILGVLTWLGTHPRLVAPYASRLVSRHLLRLEEGGVQVRDFRVRAFEGVDLYGVAVTLPARDGGITLVSADTVRVDFAITEALGSPPRLRRVSLSRPEVFSRAGRDTSGSPLPGGERGPELPHLVIDYLEVTDAYLEFSDRDGRLAERISRLDFRGSVHAEEEALLQLLGCDLVWPTHAATFSGLRGEVRVAPDRIAASELSGSFNGHEAVVSGYRGWDESLDLAISARGVSIAEVEELIDQTIGFRAQGDFDGTLRTVGEVLVYAGTFGGELEGFQMENLQGRALIGDEEVVLEGMTGRVNGAYFSGGGHVDISSPDRVLLLLEGDVADVDLARGLVPGEDDLPTTDGRGRLRIEFSDRPQWTRVSGVLGDGRIDILPFDTCMVDVTATPDTVHFNRVELWYNDLHGLLTGAADADAVFRGSVSATSEDLATLPPDWGWPPLAGRAVGLGTVFGPVDSLQFTGWLDLHDFALKPGAVANAAVALAVDDVLGDQVFTADVDGQGLRLGDVDLGAFRLRGSASARGARVDTFRTVLGDTTVVLDFRAAFTDSLAEFRVGAFRVGLEGTDWELERPVTIVVGDGHLAVSELVVASDQGSFAATGRYRRDRAVSGSVQLEGFDLGLLNPFVDSREPLAGLATADIAVGGDPAQPRVSLTADLVAAPFTLAHVDSLHLEAGISQGVVEIQTLNLETSYGDVGVTGTVGHPGAPLRDFWPGADLDLRLRFFACDWAFLDQFRIPALDRLSGDFAGDVTLAGTTDDPLLQGRISSAPFNIHWLHLDQLTGEVWADRDALVLGDLRGDKLGLELSGRIEIPLRFDLHSEPEAPLDGPFYMQVEIPRDSDLGPLAKATNAFVQASGRGWASVVVSGPLERPLYQGSLEIRDAGFVIRNLEEIYYDASCSGEFRGDELIVTGIEGREGLKGRFQGDGRVVFDGLDLKTFDIRLDVDRFLVASLPDLRGVVNGRSVRLEGVKVGPDSLLVPRFVGTLEVVKGRYTGDFGETAGGVDPLQATVAPDWLADLHLTGEPRTARIVNREMELDLGGDLDLVRDESGLYLRGTLDVNSGLLNVFANKFKVLGGRLDFSRELGFDPRVDVDAETRYRLRSQYSSNSVVEHIGVHMGGRLREPVITFTSERGYSREAIQRMLLGLEPYATPEGDSEQLRSTGISAGFNVIERVIARDLQVPVVDTIEIDQIQRRREPGSAGIEPLFGVGKYFGSDLYLKYAQGVRQDDQDFVVEYQINQHLLLQSEVRRRIDENLGQPTYNLDFKYRFEY